MSRDWELKTAANGVYYAIGGKITSSRQDAARIVDTVCEKLSSAAKCTTQEKLLPWAPPGNFATWFSQVTAQAVQLGIDAISAHWLLRRHGMKTPEILRQIETNAQLAQRIVPEVPLILADLLHCATNEMVVHLDDLLRRRLPLLILARLSDDQLYEIARLAADPLHWDSARVAQEISRCNIFRNQE